MVLPLVRCQIEREELERREEAKSRGGKGSLKEADHEEGEGTTTDGWMIVLDCVPDSVSSTVRPPCWPPTTAAD